MKILITSIAGRVGRAIYIHPMEKREVIRMDRTICSTTDYFGDIRDAKLLKKSFEKCGYNYKSCY